MKPAQRVNTIQEYYFSRKLKEVAKLNAEGQDIISLAIGSPDMPPSPQTIEKLCEVAHDPSAHGYQPTCGLPELRKAMAGFYKRVYGVDIDWATEVQPIIGSKEGIMYATLAFCNPGDKVLIPNPGYPTYTAVNKIFGTQIENYDLLENNGWQPDFDTLEKMDLQGVKLMWTNYPNMPTGGNARMETYEKLVDFARRHDIVVVNDNPYSLILNEHPMSIMQVPGAKDYCIELNSMSKSHNMPGWRVAMMLSNKDFISWIFKIQSNIEMVLSVVSNLLQPRLITPIQKIGTAKTTLRTIAAGASLPSKSSTHWDAPTTKVRWVCSFGDVFLTVMPM